MILYVNPNNGILFLSIPLSHGGGSSPSVAIGGGWDGRQWVIVDDELKAEQRLARIRKDDEEILEILIAIFPEIL